MIANFAIIVKITIIAKFSIFAMAEFSLSKQKLMCIAKILLPVFVLKRLHFGFSPFYPHCNFVVSYCFVISLFLSIYKPHSVTNGHQSLMQ